MASIIKRNVILTPLEYDGVAQQKGIVTFEILNTQASGFLRCYNLESKENLVFGVKVNDEMYKFKLLKGFDYLTFSLGNIYNLQFANISCALVSVKDGISKTLLIGSTETTKIYSTEILNFLNEDNLEKEQMLENKINNQNKQAAPVFTMPTTSKESEKPLVFPKLNQENLTETNNKILDETISQYEQTQTEDFLEDDALLTNFIDDLTQEDCTPLKCKNCMYKNYFYCKNENEVLKKREHVEVYSQNKEHNTQLNENVTTQTAFYDSLSGQINSLINSNIHEDVLEEVLPNSTFVRIEKDNGSYLVLGVINNEQGVPEYLCYGHPAKDINDKPFNFDNHFSYFPLDVDNPTGEGYYLSYQSAKNGENVKITLI